MERSIYFNYIEKKLNFLAFRIKQRGKFNLLDLNIHSETFFAGLLNLVYGYSLKNLNEIKQNVEGIDLIDEQNRIVVQVSSTCTKQKIEASLNKEILKCLNGYNFKFISIAEDAGDMRKKSFANPCNAVFTPNADILDISAVLKHILTMPIDKQTTVFEYVKKELGDDSQDGRLYSNLAEMIELLSREDFSVLPEYPKNVYRINEKITFNNLEKVKDLIDEYKVHCIRLDEIYSEFDRQGNNKSISVLGKIKKLYIELSNENKDPWILFFDVTQIPFRN